MFEKDIAEYRLRLKVIEFVTKVLHRLAFKGGVSFYALVIRAILNNPTDPLKSLKNFSELIDKKPNHIPFKFAMIGDRQDNDIEPPTMLLKSEYLLTFRLLSGNYSDDFPTSDQYQPTYLAETLSQIKALLLSKDIWKDKHSVYDPPIFCWNIDFENPTNEPSENDIRNPHKVYLKIGWEYILCGLRMPKYGYELTNKICRKILLEHLSDNPDQNIKPIIDSTDIYSYHGLDVTKEIQRSSRVLTALVIDSELKYKNISSCQNIIHERLNEYKKHFDSVKLVVPEMSDIQIAIKILENK